MLDELIQLLDAVPGEMHREDYVDVVTHDNCLGKRTAATMGSGWMLAERESAALWRFEHP